VHLIEARAEICIAAIPKMGRFVTSLLAMTAYSNVLKD